MFKHKFLYTLLSVILLTGCMQAPRPQKIVPLEKRTQYLQQLQHWQATGRIAISDTQENINAAFTWKQDADKFHVHFSSPFSTDTVTITGDANNFKIVATSGNTDDDVQLEKQLPLLQMSAWLKGLAAINSSPVIIKYDRCNQLQTLQQDGWLIEYQNYAATEPISLPEKLTITDGNTKAKLLVKNWQK